ncbi:hypothetical protein NHF46_03970 [Arthrobacter alpinus]|nr:hypothetical protein [Arthrobacter alpinus]
MDQTHGQQALVFDFDTIQQRQLWQSAASGPVDAFQRPPTVVTQKFSGLLRTADVLTKKIVLPDVQLLDGALFLHHGPEAVRSMLARSPHEQLDIRVVGRDKSMAECLRKLMLGSRPNEKLAIFEFSSMAVFGLDPRVLASKVSLRSNCRVKICPPSEVAAVIAAEFQAASEGANLVVTPTGVFLAMAERWNAWIDRFNNDPDSISVWDGTGFDLDSAIASRELPEPILALSEIDEGVAATIAEAKGVKGRSSLLKLISEENSGLTAESAPLVDAWWSSAYFDALARQHRCSWMRLNNTNTEGAILAASRAEDMVSVQFEGSLMKVFSDMPGTTFASAKYSARTAIANWAEAPIARNSDGLAFAILKFTEVQDRQQTKRSLWRRILWTLFLAVLGASISYYFSTAAGVLALILSVAGILLAAPIGDLAELYALRRKKMKSVIYMPGGGHD